MKVDIEAVRAVLELIRLSLQADGGDVKLIGVDDEGVVTVELQGACKGCPMSQLTLANGVERILKERVPGVTSVVPADLDMDELLNSPNVIVVDDDK